MVRKLKYLVTVNAHGHHSTQWVDAKSEKDALDKRLEQCGVRIEVSGRICVIAPGK